MRHTRRHSDAKRDAMPHAAPSAPYHHPMPLTDLQRRVCDDLAAREATMRRELAAHVAIPTGKGFEPGLNQYREMLVERLSHLTSQIDRIPGAPRPQWIDVTPRPQTAVAPVTVVARHHAGDALPRLLLAGHIDTVHEPDGPFNSLTVSPDGRTALGPGAADMKGGILIALHALESLHRCGAAINWTFLLNSDEETGSFHSDPALVAEAKRHDFGLALEPALPGGALAVERMGSGQFRIDVFGRSAHVGRDFAAGVSAVTRLGEIIAEIGTWPRPEEGLIINVGPLKGGSVTNAVPDHAACWGNVRFADERAAAELESKLLALATAADAMPRVVVQHRWNRPAKPLTPGTQRLADAARRAAESLGQSLPFTKTGGVCDGNILQHAGLPTIDTLGVRGGGLHTTEEWIEIPSLVERSQLLAVLMLQLSGM